MRFQFHRLCRITGSDAGFTDGGAHQRIVKDQLLGSFIPQGCNRVLSMMLLDRNVVAIYLKCTQDASIIAILS